MILNTLVSGEGPPVVLLHGLFGAARNLGVIGRSLAPHATVYAMDLRNHGDSPHDAVMDYPVMAADVAATMASHGVGAAQLVGHSMGGKVAMTLALSQPAFVSRLAVLDIAPVSYNHGHESYARAMRDIPLAPGLTRHAAEAALLQAVPEPPLRLFLLNNLILGEAPHWRLGLHEIAGAMPALQVWRDPPGWQPYGGLALFLRGVNSDYVLPAAEPAILARFPQARIESVAAAGHWMHAEQPQAVVALLKEFLFT